MVRDGVVSEPMPRIVTPVVLTGMAVPGLLRMLGSVAWALVAVLAIAAIPVLGRGRQ
jgi:hypothetical protein